MKLFPHQKHLKIKYGIPFMVLLVFFVQSCATFKNQYGAAILEPIENDLQDTAKVSHTFYLIGDAGNADETKSKKALELFKDRLSEASKNSTLLFLGDNIYPRGMPEEGAGNRKLAEEKIDNQIALAEGFKGKTVFINGNHDWYNGYEGVKRQADYVVAKLGDKKSFLPRKVCGIERLKINDDVVLITVDSEWFLQNWNKHPNINEDCEIKTREDFFDELRSLITKNQNKVVVLAMHHPVYSNGPHGGYFSFQKHIFPYKNIPAPVLGTVVNYLRKTSGGSPQEIQNKRYLELAKRVRTLVQGYDNVVIVSGHEHTQQYIEKDGVKQVISGAGSKEEEARAIQPVSFSSGKLGYATLDVKTDGSTWVNYYSANDGVAHLIFKKKIITPTSYEMPDFEPIQKTATASVYPEEWTQKTAWYRFLWGEHYRTYYGMPISVSVADLTQIHGGLQPRISGGGNQSLSLRLQDSKGTEYVMRGVRKSASRFVQTAVFKDQYVEQSIQGTFAERFIYDFYTTSHPFTPFIIGDLSGKAGVFHTNPELYFIPKQPVLGRYNEVYGDALYMIEERPSDGHEEEASFGNAAVIISTADVIQNLRKDEKYQVDEKAFLRARLFDLLIGDWDRHADQWRWAEFKTEDQVLYKPIPRDRDQAFAKIDGALLSLIKKLPPLRHMQSFGPKFANPRWINKTAFPLDQLLLKSQTEQDWKAMADEVTTALNDQAIESSFALLPKEVQDEAMENIISILKIRREGLKEYVGVYYKELSKYVVLAGTDKKDSFQLSRLENGDVEVTQVRIKKTGEEEQFKKIYNAGTTKEIWVYGLNDQDQFVVNGAGKSKIKLRLIGGKNKDTFTIENSKNVIVYDYKDKENVFESTQGSFRKVISNRYDLNNYDYRRLPLNVTMLLPNLGYNPDDGMKIGLNFSTVKSKFVQDPFTAKHVLKGNYSFATQGLDFAYNGYFANATTNWMLAIEAKATSPNFAQNYYGIGNETHYFDEERGDDYKRVRIESYQLNPGYRYEGDLGGAFEVGVNYEALKVEQTLGRFISENDVVAPRVFDFQQYAGVGIKYDYEQYNSFSNPTLGFGFHLESGWKSNLEDAKLNYGYLDLALNFDHPIDRKERFVWASSFKYKTRFGNQYDFYHAANLGGNGELRGFRPGRFTGKTAFVHSSDIRWNAGALRTGLLPMNYGFYAGFDYGRVWTPEEHSKTWHTAYGVGLWLNAIESVTLQTSYFFSQDGGRFVFGLGFGF